MFLHERYVYPRRVGSVRGMGDRLASLGTKVAPSQRARVIRSLWLFNWIVIPLGREDAFGRIIPLLTWPRPPELGA